MHGRCFNEPVANVCACACEACLCALLWLCVCVRAYAWVMLVCVCVSTGLNSHFGRVPGPGWPQPPPWRQHEPTFSITHTPRHTHTYTQTAAWFTNAWAYRSDRPPTGSTMDALFAFLHRHVRAHARACV